jgi:hypothetical protein
VDYRTEVISDPLPVVNPDHRRLDSQVRSGTGKLNRRLAQFGAMNMEEVIDPEPVESFYTACRNETPSLFITQSMTVPPL